MKKNLIKIFTFILIVFMLVGCGTTNKKEEETKEKKEEVDPIKEKVDSVMKDMTLDEKIGQMIIIYYYSDSMDDTLKISLDTVHPGGFILFKQNITTYDKTLKLIKDIKERSKIPMFISVDQEGGNVQRLLSLSDKTVSNIPYMYNVGNMNDTELAKDLGKVIAEELRVFGINMDFAPVLDVFSNSDNTVIGKRSFGTSSEVVSSMGLALGTGLKENGIIPVYKHFPGHGNTAVDSHVSLPIVDKTKEELYDLDLKPFQEAIKSGVDVIMIGHLAVPSITGDNTPASLSKKLVTDLLKDELGYNGLVVTDALNMKALTNYYEQNEIYVKAIEAGVDLLLMPSSSRECAKAIKQAVEEGRLSEEQIDESVRKILTLKYKEIVDDYDEYLPDTYLNSSSHQEIISKIK